MNIQLRLDELLITIPYIEIISLIENYYIFFVKNLSLSLFLYFVNIITLLSIIKDISFLIYYRNSSIFYTFLLQQILWILIITIILILT